MTPAWVSSAVFYHVYPLGLCGAPEHNDFHAVPVSRLKVLHKWIDHLVDLGVNALYLGPLFESTGHGYDTADYFCVDRRLGTNEDLRDFITALKARGIRVIFDAVFNHVGRDFWALRDLQVNGEESRYRDWFYQIDFSRRSPYGDAFSYEGWAGHYDLVKLNVNHPAVQHHLFEAVRTWIEQFDIDGLRLDAADVIDVNFLRELSSYTRAVKQDFWLMGEMVHGDYRTLACDGCLDATTNYECYKGLYSSHVDRNYFEIAHSLNRLYGEGGLYRHLTLYNFVDNHDVNRITSNLTKQAHLYPLHILLFTMPGVPSIYYGSEWGIQGRRSDSSDRMLRPALDVSTAAATAPEPNLAGTIARLSAVRKNNPALQQGHYRQLHVASESFAFARETNDQRMIVCVNSSDNPVGLELPHLPQGTWVDLLNPGITFENLSSTLSLQVDPNWGRVLELRD